MGELFQLGQRKRFSLLEANGLLPLINRISEAASLATNDLLARIESLKKAKASEADIKVLERKVADQYSRWHIKMEKIGVVPKGMWLVDFDYGAGFYCWKYPELEIKFHHGYLDGFLGRQPIESQAIKFEDAKNKGKKAKISSKTKTTENSGGPNEPHPG